MISNLSNWIIPLLFFIILLYGILKKQDIYQEFLKGVTDGFYIVFEITPTLIGLFLSVGMMRASGFMEFLLRNIAPAADFLEIPTDLIPVVITKIFSSSAATGLFIDILKEHGPDSVIGFMTALVLSSTETVFYTMSVYFGAIGIKKTRWTLPGALLCIIAGTAASVIIGKILF